MATNPATEDVAKVQSNKSLGPWNCKVETMWKWCRASLRQLRQGVACVSGYSCHFSHESAWEALKFFGSNRLAAMPAEPAGRQRRKHRPVQTKAPYPTNRTNCGMKADQVIEKSWPMICHKDLRDERITLCCQKTFETWSGTVCCPKDVGKAHRWRMKGNVRFVGRELKIRTS